MCKPVLALLFLALAAGSAYAGPISFTFDDGLACTVGGLGSRRHQGFELQLPGDDQLAPWAIPTRLVQEDYTSSNRKPQVSLVMCSDSVRGYFRQFIGRMA